MIKEMIEKNKEKDFGDGRFVLNLDRLELYNFLKVNLPEGFICDTFEEFNNNLVIEEYEDDEIQEVGLTYTKKDKNGCFILELVDDYIYAKSEGKNELLNNDELVINYEKFIASHFPEYKEIYLKQILEKKRHYQKFYGEECRKAYKIFKSNMNVSYDRYKEIFGEDCPISKV